MKNANKILVLGILMVFVAGTFTSIVQASNEKYESMATTITEYPLQSPNENPYGIACAPFSLSVNHEGKHTIELAYSKLKGLSDSAIIGVIAHELGHVLVVHHYGHDEEYDIEAWADECAELMGFEAEIKTMREEIDQLT